MLLYIRNLWWDFYVFPEIFLESHMCFFIFLKKGNPYIQKYVFPEIFFGVPYAITTFQFYGEMTLCIYTN